MRSVALASALSALLVGAVGAQSNRPVFRAESNVVVIPASVTDNTGHVIPGLTKDDFELLDDGRKVDISQFAVERVPISLGVVVDISGSITDNGAMPSRWIDTVAALHLLLRDLDGQDEVFLGTFRDTPQLVMNWTRQFDAVTDSLAALEPRGRTELFLAVTSLAPTFRLAHNQRRVLLLISDGKDMTPSGERITRRPSPSPTPDTEARMEQSRDSADDRGWENQSDPRRRRLIAVKAAIDREGLLLYALGMGTGRTGAVDSDTLHALTEGTGGYVSMIQTPADIKDSIERISADLKSQYVLGFTSPHHDGKLHHVTLRLRSRRGRIRSRTAYIAN